MYFQNEIHAKGYLLHDVFLYESHCMNCFFLVGVKLACTNQGFLVFGEQQHF
jgi:hypothetical protein